MLCNTISVKSYHNILSNNLSCRSCKGNSRTPTLNAPRNAAKARYIKGAKERNLEFNLSDDEFDSLIFGNCHYCNSLPEEHDRNTNHTEIPFLRNGIDRVDSSKGYTIDNCVTCCSTCNRMKSNMSCNDFIKHIQKIYNYSVNKGSTTSHMT